MREPGLTSRGGRQSGVTLIEIVVALALVGLTLGIAAGGLRLLGRSGARGAEVIARHDGLSRGLDVLRHDIERLERVVWKRGETAEVVFHGDAARLAFVAVEPAFPTEAGPYFLIYSIQQRPDGAELTRTRAPYQASVPDLRRLAGGDAVAVVEGRYRLRFLYLERKDGRQRWVPQWTDAQRLPELISLEVSGLTEGAAPLPPLVFHPRADAERSCLKDDSGACSLGGRGAPEPEAGAGGRRQP
jgi:prepilin-type N-terminal cleavage/methylation domain-containing protein